MKDKNKVAIILLIVVFFLLGKILFLPGMILGGDWGFPFSLNQMEMAINDGIWTWTNQGNLLGMRQSALTSAPLHLITKVSHLLKIDGSIFIKLLLISIFFLASYSMYSLLKFFKVRKSLAVLGGIVYITTPIFFNYLIMGWGFVLFIAGLFPLAVKYFIKAVQEEKIRYAIFVGIIYAVSIIQAQSIIWFPIIFGILGFYLIKNKKNVLTYVKSLGTVFVIFLLLNAYWILGLLLVPDKAISGSDIVNSAVSLGTLGHFQPFNILRLFGSLFNFQYETILNNSYLSILSFLMPIVVVGSLFIKNNRRKIITFWLIALVPIAMYIVNFYRDLLIYIPFSNVFRDFARFTILSTFAYSILFTLFLSYLFRKKTRRAKKLGYALIFVWILSIFPWWTGELTNWKDAIGSDMRIRTKNFSDDYHKFEKKLSSNKLDQKMLYIPIGGVVDYKNDKKFHGMFKEAQDIFAGYSPIPGIIVVSDRNFGYIDKYTKAIGDNVNKDILNTLKLTNVGYFAVRNDVKMDDREYVKESFNREVNNGRLKKYFNKKDIDAYNVTNFTPHFYVPTDIIISRETVSTIAEIISSHRDKDSLAIIFKEQNKGKRLLFKNNQSETKPTLEFKKINPTKYRVRIHNAKGSFPLIFSESFHDEWKIYPAKAKKSEINSSQLENYKMIDINKDYQADIDEIKKFIDKNLITSLGNSNDIGFISKKLQNAIQNNNLPNGSILESWSKDPIAENIHFIANGYANGWYVDTDTLCKNINICDKNVDDTQDFELVIEFWPQRTFYIGIIISLVTFFGCITYIAYDWKKNYHNIDNRNIKT